MLSSEPADFDVDIVSLDRLLKMQERESRAIAHARNENAYLAAVDLRQVEEKASGGLRSLGKRK